MLPIRVLSLARLLNNSFRCFGTNSRRMREWKPFDEVDAKNHVANIFLCNQNEAGKLVNSIKDAFERDHSGRIGILQALRRKGLTIKNASNCKTALKLPYEALKDDSPSTIICVLRMSDKDFHAVANLLTYNSERLEQLSELFKKTPFDTSLLLIKYPFLIRSRPSTLKEKLDLLVGKGMSIEDVGKDLWALTYTMARLKQRLEEIETMEIRPIKPWMLRCLPQTIQRTYQYRLENQEALGPHPNATAFLANRLAVTEEDIEIFARKHPPVLRVHVAKMKEIIDYLTAEGYSTRVIVRTPRILCHSINTIQERLAALKLRNYSPKVLSVLCKSARSFNEFLKKVESCRNDVDETSLKL